MAYRDRLSEAAVRLLVFIAACATGSAAAHAQVLRVEVSDSARGGGIVGALVTATQPANGARSDALTNDRGIATLRLPTAGRWSVSVRRIGIAPRALNDVTVDAGVTTSITIRMPAIRQLLPTVRVRASACGSSPQGTDRTSVLWEQITLALRASVLSRGDSAGMIALRFTEQIRELSPSLEERSRQVVRSGIGVGRIYSAADPDTLAEHGYVVEEANGGRQYFAPDEVVFLSDAFERTHCFDTPDVDADPAFAELRFRPAARGRVSDVEGTALVDTLTGELRRIDFRYVMPAQRFPVAAKHAGGTVELRRLSNGRWIVSNWAIRMPVFRVSALTASIVLSGYREVGGTVTPVSETESPAPLKRDDDPAVSRQ